MSKVFSYRLDADNPREAQAIEIIDTWVSRGYSLRHILTEALIEDRESRNRMREWDIVYEQLLELVLGLENGLTEKETISDDQVLSKDFVNAMKIAVRSGMRNE